MHGRSLFVACLYVGSHGVLARLGGTRTILQEEAQTAPARDAECVAKDVMILWLTIVCVVLTLMIVGTCYFNATSVHVAPTPHYSTVVTTNITQQPARPAVAAQHAPADVQHLWTREFPRPLPRDGVKDGFVCASIRPPSVMGMTLVGM